MTFKGVMEPARNAKGYSYKPLAGCLCSFEIPNGIGEHFLQTLQNTLLTPKHEG